LFTISSYNSKKEIFMRSIPERQLVILACLLVAPALGISDTVTGIQASGGGAPTCGYGSCTAPALTGGALTLGTSTSGSYTFNETAIDGDVYNVSGTFKDTFFSGTSLGFFPTVTLVSTTAVGADTITLDMLQDFSAGTDATSWSGTYNEKLPFVLSAAGTGEGQVLYSTDLDTTPQSVGEKGPVSGPGSFNLVGSAAWNPLSGQYLIGDFQFTFSFPEGSTAGSSISSPVPEPSPAIPAAIGLVACLLLFKLREIPFKRNSPQANMTNPG
jgi:hypothetical protein